MSTGGAQGMTLIAHPIANDFHEFKRENFANSSLDNTQPGIGEEKR